MQFRTAVESDRDLVLTFESHDPISWPGTDRHRRGIEDGSWRLSNTWLAVDGDGTVKAMARFWAPPVHDKPESLDGLYVDASVPDRAGLATRLLDVAHKHFGTRPDFHMFLPPTWRENPDVADAVTWRREALAPTGMTEELERLRYEWTPEAGVPEPDPRLEFHRADDETFVDAFCKVSQGSLDVGTRKGIDKHGIEAEARDHMSVYLQMRGDRDWWRLGYTIDGQLVGLAIPSANAGGPVVGYLGVVPEHRGKGYVDPLLGEITRRLAAHDADSVFADTDTVNLPMAAAFERAGYAHVATRLVISEST